MSWACRTEDGIVNRWLFVRYLVIGLYVGAVTCGGFAWWYTLAPVRALQSFCTARAPMETIERLLSRIQKTLPKHCLLEHPTACTCHLVMFS